MFIICNLAIISFFSDFVVKDIPRNACSDGNGCMKWQKIRQNRQICRADFALTNLTEIRRNRQLGRLGRTQSLET